MSFFRKKKQVVKVDVSESFKEVVGQQVLSNKKKSNLLGDMVKVTIFAVIGVVIVVGNFFFENAFVFGGEVFDSKFVAIDYVEENILPNNGVIRFADEDEYGFVNNMELHSMDSLVNEYVFDFDSGKFWGFFQASDAKVNIVADRVVLIPDNASFDVEFDGNKLDLSVFDGDVYLGFLDQDMVVEEYVDQYDQMFMNKILVPRDTQVSIRMSKIDDRVRQLLYSKLVKEFKYAQLSSSKKGEDWVLENQNSDQKFLETLKQKYVSESLARGAVVADSFFADFVFWAEENLTFVPEKKNQIILDHLFAFLDNAIFYSVNGQLSESKQSFNQFELYYLSLPNDNQVYAEYYDLFDKIVDEFSIFGPDDIQYELLRELRDEQFNDHLEIFKVVNDYWLDVYIALDLGDVAAEEALNNYYQSFDKTIGKNANENFYLDYINYNNQLVGNLLLKYPVFYKDGYFAIKNALEHEYLRLFGEGQLKNELRQDLISSKIDYLKRLMKFFFEGKVTIPEAKEILARLVSEIDDLMPADSSDVAVLRIFESQLEDIGDFWGYLNTPEYHTSRTYGDNQKERYKSYLADKDVIWSFINIQQDVLGEDVELTGDVKDVKDEIESIFREEEAVSQIVVGEVEAFDQRYVSVEGVIGGYPFEAEYDRDQDNLRNVDTYGELVSDRPVRLDKLLDLMVAKFADLADPIVSGEELTEETFAQRAARVYLADLVEGYGFEVGLENVSVVNELNAVYRIEDISMADSEDVTVTFDFLMNGETVTNLFLVVRGSPVVLDGKFKLEDLQKIVLAEGDLAAFEDDEAFVVEKSSEPKVVTR